jgi:hypothetical protein
MLLKSFESQTEIIGRRCCQRLQNSARASALFPNSAGRFVDFPTRQFSPQAALSSTAMVTMIELPLHHVCPMSGDFCRVQMISKIIKPFIFHLSPTHSTLPHLHQHRNISVISYPFYFISSFPKNIYEAFLKFNSPNGRRSNPSKPARYFR